MPARASGPKLDDALDRLRAQLWERLREEGRVREVPLMYVPYGDGVVLVASMAGSPKHPTWDYNLKAHPDITVTVHGKEMPLVAREASDAEKAAVWPLCCEHYTDFDLYQRRTPRNIPVFICEPAA